MIRDCHCYQNFAETRVKEMYQKKLIPYHQLHTFYSLKYVLWSVHVSSLVIRAELCATSCWRAQWCIGLAIKKLLHSICVKITEHVAENFFQFSVLQRSGFDSRRYQIVWEVVDLERGPLSLVSTIEELLERKSSGSGLENWDYSHRESAALTMWHLSICKSWH
jgi:hypothetical protein